MTTATLVPDVAPTRRAFLQGGSLVVLFGLGGLQPLAAQAPAAAPLPGSLNSNRRLDAWIRIQPDGTLTMFTGKVELGQGILTALTQIVADELDVEPQRLQVVSGDTGRTPNEGVTSGSLSIQDSGTALRMACAEARALLLAAAAQKLDAPVGELTVRDGTITRASTGARTTYWEVAPEASLAREATAKVAPKPAAARRHIGQSMPRRDIPAKVTGGPAYVQDIRLPGMVHARVVRPPLSRPRLLEANTDAVRAMPGVLAVVRDGSFLAVAAQREEQAIAAARALHAAARWEPLAPLPPTGAGLYTMMKTARADTSVVGEKNAGAAPPADAAVLTAEFTRPYQAHGSIGPSCALAQWDEGKLQVWCHSQGVFPLRADMAKALRLPPAAITIVHHEGSGCYGHNGADDVALDAALVARALPRVPVRLQWMREDEFGTEPFGSPMVMQLRGAVAGGKVADWQHEVWSYTHSTRPNDPEGSNLLAAWQIANPLPPGPSRNIPQPSGGSDRNAVPLYAFGRHKVVNHLLLDQPIRTSALRTLGAYANVFAAESFLDELAGAAGADPVQFRLAHLEDPRARAVIERVAAMSNWRPTPAPDTREKRAVAPGQRRGRGIAFAKYKNLAVYCAVVAEVVVDTASGAVRVTDAWSVADAGMVVNPDGFRNQIEGGIIQSTSWTLHEAIAWDAKGVTTHSWPDYPILRFPEMPRVVVELIDRPEERPLGVGEGSQGPTVAAIANAIAQATGRRPRDIPFTAEKMKALLA
ncbi:MULTISPECIES: xanthine dehydrogenase family protein molybdopterin-binding subunit [Ramlibacter]|uniref:Molybdopterin-dependent oxidoreductase n=1 Tax=Ramlibacter pinisoli TaxID=2682844 RepID=A0A6N8IR56_9BURK|nr:MULTISPECIES: molybdopterin cofactor-binding domain-containing protein [Ramlibacter]MBA2964433.1 xanthine dehydrogenase family protein molybdopterin-binding subunit [Ramlibacter sp. CGMCC 1.13660]MVQ29399.1 molybdopterin-dependent oxidoreductase [Ramlibacter pinisoli]